MDLTFTLISGFLKHESLVKYQPGAKNSEVAEYKETENQIDLFKHLVPNFKQHSQQVAPDFNTNGKLEGIELNGSIFLFISSGFFYFQQEVIPIKGFSFNVRAGVPAEG